MTNKSTDTRVGFLLASIVRARKLWARQILGPCELTPPQYAVLARLAECDGLSVGEIARRLYADMTMLSRTIGRMERAGLVTRQRCEADRRTCEVWLTDLGRERIASIQPRIEAAEHQLVNGLDEDAIATLKDLLRVVLSNVVRDTVAPVDEPAEWESR
ncbi:MAG TPA: MarR family transcriptional regulator [Kofleriaceae bacterium]|nr:MarR family transcriptional regulator [Kofleriaceae bacterium]